MIRPPAAQTAATPPVQEVTPHQEVVPAVLGRTHHRIHPPHHHHHLANRKVKPRQLKIAKRRKRRSIGEDELQKLYLTLMLMVTNSANKKDAINP